MEEGNIGSEAVVTFDNVVAEEPCSTDTLPPVGNRVEEVAVVPSDGEGGSGKKTTAIKRLREETGNHAQSQRRAPRRKGDGAEAAEARELETKRYAAHRHSQKLLRKSAATVDLKSALAGGTALPSGLAAAGAISSPQLMSSLLTTGAVTTSTRFGSSSSSSAHNFLQKVTRDHTASLQLSNSMSPIDDEELHILLPDERSGGAPPVKGGVHSTLLLKSLDETSRSMTMTRSGSGHFGIAPPGGPGSAGGDPQAAAIVSQSELPYDSDEAVDHPSDDILVQSLQRKHSKLSMLSSPTVGQTPLQRFTTQPLPSTVVPVASELPPELLASRKASVVATAGQTGGGASQHPLAAHRLGAGGGGGSLLRTANPFAKMSEADVTSLLRTNSFVQASTQQASNGMVFRKGDVGNAGGKSNGSSQLSS